jgi:hypothetical protein
VLQVPPRGRRMQRMRISGSGRQRWPQSSRASSTEARSRSRNPPRSVTTAVLVWGSGGWTAAQLRKVAVIHISSSGDAGVIAEGLTRLLCADCSLGEVDALI